MDIDLHWLDTHADTALTAHGDLATDDGLRTAVLLSLFTDRRAASDDALPDGSSDRRGWWADAWPAAAGDQFGSRLWLLHREKQMLTVVARAQTYAKEALAWIREDGIAANVQINAEAVRMGVLGLRVVVSRPDGRVFDDHYQMHVEAR